jgi:predicted ATPase/DNA-binding winged helix-turn-helix (wHTH) protein
MVTSPSKPDDEAYLFGPFRLIPSRQLLLRDGLPVPIGGRALDILTLLARRPGEVVTKADILKFCWPDVFVHESNIKVNVAALRRALSERPGKPYIATVTGRGYRFVAQVDVERTETPAAGRPAAMPSRALKQPLIIGRSQELESIAQKLASARCITIVGPGGVGKTTIALAVAHHVQRNYPDGVSFVDLSSVGDAQYAAAAIAAGVGVRQRSEDALSEIIALIQDRQMLLILDNCEHLNATMTRIVNRLLEAVPTLALLATSREPLWSKAEEIYRLSSLDVPTTEAAAAAKTAMEFSAVRLFIKRAQERGRYVLSDADAPDVSAICRHLDGLPLAIELVASKVFAYGISTLLTMLEQKFLLLGNRERTAPLRQQTFLATLDWSYRLLSEDEAALLRLLSVFAGGFRRQDAIAMSQTAGLDAAQTIDALERLTSKSLVYAERQGGVRTYRLLNSTRAYAVERLEGTGEREAALQRHATYVLSLFETAADELDSRDSREWMADYAERVDDLRNAMIWAFDVPGDRMLGIRLTVAAIPLWYELSSLGEMQSRVERALLASRDIGDCPTDLILKLMAAKASGMSFSQHLAATEAAWQECYELGVKTGSVKYELFGLWGIASHHVYVGRIMEGIECFHKFIALAESQNDASAVDEGLRSLAQSEIYVGKIRSARQRLEVLAARYQQPSEPVQLARFQAEKGVAIRCSLAHALWAAGEPVRALQVMREAIERTDVSGHIVSQSNALARFAIPIAFWTGDFVTCGDFLTLLEENGRSEDIGMWREVCLFFRSALDAKRKVPGAAVAVRRHVDVLTSVGHSVRAPMHYSMAAEAFLDAGALEDARATIAVAHDFAHKQSAKWCLPEILRVEALIELQLGNAGEAEQLLRRAIAEASAIDALTLELRAALSLSAKLEGDGLIDEAFEVLRTVSARFGNSDVFADLEEAHDRLVQLQTIGAKSKVLPARSLSKT